MNLHLLPHLRQLIDCLHMLESLHGVAATLCWIQKRAVPSCFTEKSCFCDQQRERTQNLFNAFLFGFALGVPASLEISNPWVSPLYTGKLATGHAEHPFIDPTLWKNASGTRTMQKLLFGRNVCCSTSLSAPLIQAPLSRYRGRVHNTPAGERGHVVCAT